MPTFRDKQLNAASATLASTSANQLDDLVQYITLHVPIQFILSLAFFPFLVLYAIWFYVSFILYEFDFNEGYEAVFISMVAITVCFLFVNLCCFWNVHLKTFLYCRKVKYDLPQRNVVAKVCPTKNNGSPALVNIHTTIIDKRQVYWFMFQKVRYVWNGDQKQFRAIEFPIDFTYDEYAKWKGFRSDDEIDVAKKTYGDNQMEMVVPEFLELFVQRATAPFFVFQLFSVCLWFLDEYWYYSLFTLFMLIMFECTLVQQQLRNMAEIRKMGNKPHLVQVYRNSKWRPIVSSELVPGDLISICRSKNDIYVPCDVLLLRGTCIVDESMLTGESVPQLKESLENVDDLRPTLDVDGEGKLFVLFGGTKVVQHTAPNKNALRAPDDGCIAYVLRTGFNTSQGRLLRTILFSVKRVTENNKETFAFILFLMIFAVAAASYVWIKGTEDVNRNRYRLFLECTLILTSIIPPDLPIELSLAVNTSLIQLSKLYVYCTEPFRIPMAGKIQICCFDKTGTLTSDDLVLDGVAGIDMDPVAIPMDCLPDATLQVLGTCHSLAQLDDGLVGDPLEKATLTTIGWTLTRQDWILPPKGKAQNSLKIFQRYHFLSALKRMSVLCGHIIPTTNEHFCYGCVKGAPEIIKTMLKEIPDNYEKIYLEYARKGARVLALARKVFGKLDPKVVRELKREDVESDLEFVGFLIISCPLKPDSKNAVKELMKSSHKVVMITGDNPLTACHVAKELRITRKTTLLLTKTTLEKENGMNNKVGPLWIWQSIDQDVNLGLDDDDLDGNAKRLISEYDLCITGEGLTYLNDTRSDYFLQLCPYISVYARFAPKQKEFIVTTLKQLGYYNLMCGDGTNDVGALKHAHVGVSILSNNATIRTKKPMQSALDGNNLTSLLTPAGGSAATATGSAVGSAASAQNSRRRQDQMSVRERAIARHREQMNNSQEKLQQVLKEMDEDQVRIVKLGDASIAAPFTSKLSSINSVCHIIKQGRCTLVTTLQMFKILALNSLISAYCQSVLYVGGVKFSDTQATLQGLFIALCFLFIIRTKPLKALSREAPLPNIFNMYTLTTILLQFTVHCSALVYLVYEAEALMPANVEKFKFNSDYEPGEKEDFVPNIVNSTVYIICMTLQVATFAVNHKGHPFMENLHENKLLMYAIITSATVVTMLTFGLSSVFNETFQIIDFTPDFQTKLFTVLLADVIFALLVDRICSYLFGSHRRKSDNIVP